MEKQRRDRMNKALEDLKVIIIRHDPNHTSKLEKADILEKTLELVRFFEFQISQIQQQTATIFDDLAKNKSSSPEVIKSMISKFSPPQIRQPLQQQSQQQIIPPSSVPTMPLFNQHLSRMPPPPPQTMHPLFFQAAVNSLLFPSRTSLLQNFLQQSNAMAQSSSSSTTTSTNTQIKSEIQSSPTKTYETESRSNSRAQSDSSRDDDDGKAGVIDVDDKHDDTFSPPITPPKQPQQEIPIQSRKRSRNSSFSNPTSESAAVDEGDSGIFDGPSPPKKPSFGINDLLK
uniref:BHLH domain-containing protein n=1 Tax=Panagrolaimus superbus TaxID=310955 RepID=A0A914Z8Y0_9BILA